MKSNRYRASVCPEKVGAGTSRVLDRCPLAKGNFEILLPVISSPAVDPRKLDGRVHGFDPLTESGHTCRILAGIRLLNQQNDLRRSLSK